jgi:hypothetical protein
MVLELRFAGLCLFVQDADSRTVHALLPGVPGAPSDAPRPMLVVDAAYLREGSVACDGEEVRLGLPRGVLSLSGYPVAALPNSAPTRRAPVPPDMLGPDAARALAGRITLRGGTLVRRPAGGQWTFSDDAVPLSVETVWTAQIHAPSLHLNLAPLTGADEQAVLPPLFPIDDRIEIRIEGLPPGAIPVPAVPEPAGARKRSGSRSRRPRNPADGSVSLHIHTATAGELCPVNLSARPDAVEDHFSALYRLFQPGESNDSRPSLPENPAPDSDPGEPRG